MLKQSQKRMNRAALVDAPMSSTPASTAGWLATTPTERPPSRAKPTTMLSAKPRWTSRNAPSSTTAPDHVVHVVRLGGAVRHHVEQRFVAAVVGIGCRADAAARRGC